MNAPEPPIRAAIYARISLDRNGEALGVERQVESCNLMAQARKWTVAPVPGSLKDDGTRWPDGVLVDNDLSAYSGVTRPEYERLLKLIVGGQVDAVLVWHMDRMCRRVADLVQFTKLCKDSGVKISSVSGDFDFSSPMGQPFATILIAVAEYEAAHKGERQVAANQQAARNGERRLGTPRPFGWEDDHRTERPAEAEAIRWAADALLQGSTISAVCREWAARGLVPPQQAMRGSRQGWTRNSVTTILRNPALAGICTYKGEVMAEDAWPPILPRATWEAVLSLLEDPARTPPRGVRTLLGGIARCQCGNYVVGAKSSRGARIYKCNPTSRNGALGPHYTGRAEPVDDYVTRIITGRLALPDVADLIVPPCGVDAVALRTEAQSIRRNLDELAAEAAVHGFSKSMLAAANKRATARLAEIAAQLAASASASALAPFVAGQQAEAVWADLDDPRRREVIKTLATLTLLPAGQGVRVFDPTTVQIGWLSPS